MLKKPLAVHVEMPWITCSLLEMMASRLPVVAFVLTPVNYEYAVAFCGFRGTKREYEEVLLSCYERLKRVARLELHLHLSLLPELLPRGEKERMFREAVEWGRSHGMEFREWVPGWWRYDRESLEIAESLGLRMAARTQYLHFHDYDLIDYTPGFLRRLNYRSSTTFLVIDFIKEAIAWFIRYSMINGGPIAYLSVRRRKVHS